MRLVSIHYQMIGVKGLVTMCHHTKLLQCYWLYIPYAVPDDLFILYVEVCSS